MQGILLPRPSSYVFALLSARVGTKDTVARAVKCGALTLVLMDSKP